MFGIVIFEFKKLSEESIVESFEEVAARQACGTPYAVHGVEEMTSWNTMPGDLKSLAYQVDEDGLWKLLGVGGGSERASCGDQGDARQGTLLQDLPRILRGHLLG